MLAVTAGIFIYGFFVTKWLGRLLEHILQAEGLSYTAHENSLKIGLANPLTADCLLYILEEFSKIKPEAAIYLSAGAEDELLNAFAVHKLDVVFLPEGTAVPEKIHGNVREVMLYSAPVVTKYGGLPVEPVTKDYFSYDVLWSEWGDESVIHPFIICLNSIEVFAKVKTANKRDII